nr:hypothetical protein [Mycobacterium avium]
MRHRSFLSSRIVLTWIIERPSSLAEPSDCEPTYPGAGSSSSTNAPKILRDVMFAEELMRSLKQGYRANTVVLDLQTFAAVMGDPNITAALPREDMGAQGVTKNPIFEGIDTGLAVRMLGKTWLSTPNLPGGPFEPFAAVLDSTIFGGLLPEPFQFAPPAGLEPPMVDAPAFTDWVIAATIADMTTESIWATMLLTILMNAGASTIGGSSPAGGANWNGSGSNPPKILRDVMFAEELTRSLKQGYRANTVVLDLQTFAAVMGDPNITAALPREDMGAQGVTKNPIFEGIDTGLAVRMLGKTWLSTPNLPGGPFEPFAAVLDSTIFGAFVVG